jgi:hypothetical protein
MRYLLITFAIILIGCSRTSYSSVKLSLSIYNSVKKHHRPTKYSFVIPNGYAYKEIHGHGVEYQFIYKDSSVIYITDEDIGNFNDSIIEHDSTLYLKRKEMRFTQQKNDFKGVDKNGLNWREVEYNGVSIGYYRVKSNLINQYDNFITKAHRKLFR